MAKKKSVSKYLKSKRVRVKRKTPLWDGPSVNSKNGGLTQSLLKDFLVCRERCRLKLVYGYQPKDMFNKSKEYGDMWHLCEEKDSENKSWKIALKRLATKLCTRYRSQQKEVVQCYNLCKLQFPVYKHYWRQHKDVKSRKEVLSEEKFCIPYTLPDSRIVFLRGKFDSADSVVENRKRLIYLQENKTKGKIEEDNLFRQLGFDLQTMIYLVCLIEYLKNEGEKTPVAGVRYNVVRRPLSGGRHSIRMKQPTKKEPKGESEEEFYNRLQDLIADDPDYFFMRWKTKISETDVQNFKNHFLNPILMQLLDWWDWITSGNINNPWEEKISGSEVKYNYLHFRYPYGIYNPMNDGGFHFLDNHLNSNSNVGLIRANTLFPELQ